MKNPIILDEHGDISFFASKAAAEQWVEVIDIENGEYDVFDAEGQILEIKAHGRFGLISEMVPPKYAPEDLKHRLSKCFESRKDKPSDLHTYRLDELVAYGMKTEERRT